MGHAKQIRLSEDHRKLIPVIRGQSISDSFKKGRKLFGFVSSNSQYDIIQFCIHDMQLQVEAPLEDIQIGLVIDIAGNLLKQGRLKRSVFETPFGIVIEKVITFIPGLLKLMV